MSLLNYNRELSKTILKQVRNQQKRRSSTIVKRTKKQKERRRQYLNTSKETLKHATTYLGNPILGVAASATIELVYGLEEEHDLTGKAYKALVDSFFD